MGILENDLHAEKHLLCSECPELNVSRVCSTLASGGECPVRQAEILCTCEDPDGPMCLIHTF